MSTCNNINDLVDVEAIKPIVIGSIGSGVTVTHKGYVRFLPRAIGVCFYSPLMTVNLISLGAICRGGGSYHTCPGELALEIMFNDVVVAKTHLTSNNLLPIPLNLIKTNLYLSLLNETSDLVVPPPTHTIDDDTSPQHAAANTHHINKEELLGAQIVVDLHFYLDHPSDGALCQALNQNSFTGLNVTSTDVATNRRLRGPCPICLEAKLKQKPMPPSVTPPATSIGQTLSLDIHKLTTCTPGGYTHELTMVDEKSGRIDVVASKSKKPTDVYAAIWEVLQLYNRSRFVVQHIHVDEEYCFPPLKAALGSIAILLTISTPEQHAQRVERYTQTLDIKVTAALQSMDYELPAKYIIYVKQHAAHMMNIVPNSKSFPSSAHILTMH